MRAWVGAWVRGWVRGCVGARVHACMCACAFRQANQSGSALVTALELKHAVSNAIDDEAGGSIGAAELAIMEERVAARFNVETFASLGHHSSLLSFLKEVSRPPAH